MGRAFSKLGAGGQMATPECEIQFICSVFHLVAKTCHAETHNCAHNPARQPATQRDNSGAMLCPCLSPGGGRRWEDQEKSLQKCLFAGLEERCDPCSLGQEISQTGVYLVWDRQKLSTVASKAGKKLSPSCLITSN